MTAQTRTSPPPAPTPPQTGDSRRGLAFAVTAYMIWGLFPLYMKALAHIPVAEVLAHRVLWSVPVAGVVLWWTGRSRDLVAALRSPRMLAMGALTAGLISANWAIYVWAIVSDHAMEAALGYYINPLFSVLLGALVLHERLSRLQWAAIALAGLAVAVLTVEGGRFPLVALSLTLTFGLYGYAKKKLPIGPNQGFMLEVLILLPLALGWAVWLQINGTSHFLAGSATDTWLLVGAGAMTAATLIIYANGARLLPLSTIGVLQYIVPTMLFVQAVFLFGEPFDRARMIAFPMIWTAVVLYTLAVLRPASPTGR